MRQAGHMVCIRKGRNVYRVSVGKPKGRGPLEDQGIDGRMG
jgi:hypothetical protein